MKKIISLMHQAIKDYKMIKEGDKIAIGLSCGKDSLTLLKVLSMYQKHSINKFEIIAITIDIFGNTDYTKVEEFCKKINIELVIIRTNINEKMLNKLQGKNPCSLCANLRRGHLYSKAKELGCNKVALGHHADDLIETFFMSMFKENRLNTFWPILYLSRQELYVIRPFVYVFENQITNSLTDELPIIKNSCLFDKKTYRESIKNIITDLTTKVPEFKYHVLESLIQTNRYNLLDKSKLLSDSTNNSK